MRTTTEQHSFLDLLTEGEAIAQGVNLTDRFAHHVYRAVLARSTSGALSREEFFTTDTLVRELPGLAHSELVSTLAGLVRERVVCQVIVLENEPGDRSLRVRPCFLARSERSGPLFPLFLQTLHRCEEAVHRRITALDPIGPDELQADLELDLAASRQPRAAQLLGLAGGLLDALPGAAFEIPPPPELIAAVCGHLRRRLLEEKAAVFLRGYGLAPVVPADGRTRFLVAEQFLEDRVLPLYRRDARLRRELEGLALEQAAHGTTGRRSTTDFSLRRAGAIRRLFVRGGGEREWFPGALTVETVLATAEAVEAEYAAEEAARRMTRIALLEGCVHPPADHLQAEFLFLSDHEWEEEHPDVRHALLENRDILYATFELPGQTAHVFGPADPELFAQCVARLYGLPQAQAWKFWAASRLLDLYALRLANLKNDLRFQRDLELSLFLNSRPYITGPLILLMIPGRLFPGIFVRRATAELVRRQHVLREGNRALHAARTLRLESSRQERARTACVRALRDMIDGRLDDFYFRERRVPSVAELLHTFVGVEGALVREALREGRYLLCAAQHAGSEESLVAFAMDDNWPMRAEQLKAHVTELMVAAESGAPERRARHVGRVVALRVCLNDPQRWMTMGKRREEAARNAPGSVLEPIPGPVHRVASPARGPSAGISRTPSSLPARRRPTRPVGHGGHFESLNGASSEGIPGPKLFVHAAD